eukprot:scaffold26310_cov108-Cylindrotheca_fusiformis.AAC.1
MPFKSQATLYSAIRFRLVASAIPIYGVLCSEFLTKRCFRVEFRTVFLVYVAYLIRIGIPEMPTTSRLKRLMP